MSEQEPKGFRIVDRRGVAGEPREERPEAPQPETAPPPPPRGQEPPVAGAGPPEGRPAPGAGAPRVGEASFLDLVGTLQFGALANLGMIQGPDGRRSPVNLPAAKDSIDLLGVLQEKTKGNLTSEEADVLNEGLYHIRMAYVAALSAAAPGPGGKKK